MKQKIMYTVSVIVGVAFWITLTKISGLSEAWDSPMYFRVGMPILIFINFILGAIAPSKPWRWGPISTVSQIIPMIAMNPTGSLLPLGFIGLLILSVPSIFASYVGAFLRNLLFRSEIGHDT